MGQSKYILPQITPKSPDVASIDKYGQIPVSLSVGVPDISIPLYEFAVNNLNIPIELKYHNNGLKVDDIPSCVGLGWDLMVGGVISYDQRGIKDFDNSYGLFNGGLNSINNFLYQNTMTEFQKFWYLEDVANGNIDSEFDIYHFNFLGNVGSFFFDASQNIQIVPKSNLKISKTALGFKIIDIKGNEFYFETGEAGRMSPLSSTEIRPSFGGNAAYHLSKIITKNNRLISFTYKLFTLQYSRNNQVLTVFEDKGSGHPGSSNDFDGMYVDQQYLIPDAIIFDHGYIKFTTSEASRLDIKKINNTAFVPSVTGLYVVADDSVIKEFSFTQNYFGDNDRLKLKSIQERSSTLLGKKWQFDYYGELSEFPPFFSKSKDHWGYYNGKPNTTLIPTANYQSLVGGWTDMLNGYYADRTSDGDKSKIGILETIKYPTGGTTTFVYEPNQIKVNSFDDVIKYPFLQWPTTGVPSTTLAFGSTVYSNSSVSTSFTINQSTVVFFSATEELDPSYLNSSNIAITGPLNSVNAMHSILNRTCTVNECRGYGNVTLEPGTYTFNLYRGFRYDTERFLEATLTITTSESNGALPPYILGGSRISEVNSVSSPGEQAIKKRYIYDDKIQNVIFRNIPNYLTSIAVNIQVSFGCNSRGRRYTISDENIKPYAGNTIEYLNVTEYDGPASANGKIEYTFTSTFNEAGSNSSPFTMPLNTSWTGGNLRFKKTFKFNSNVNQFELVNEVENTYHAGNYLSLTNGIKVEYDTYTYGLINPGCTAHRTNLSTLFTQLYYQNSSRETVYGNPNLSLPVNISATSSAHTLPTIEEHFDSKNQSIKSNITYSFDYEVANVFDDAAKGIANLRQKNILVPIEKLTTKTIAGSEYIIAGTLFVYKSTVPELSKAYQLNITSPILVNSFTKSGISSQGVFVKDLRYEEKVEIAKYDSYNNVLEEHYTNNFIKSRLWDYKNTYPVAEIDNALQHEVAYSSFESDGLGNWEGTLAANVVSNQSFTGKKSYNLANSELSKASLTAGKPYKLTFWRIMGDVVVTGGNVTTKTGRSINGWTYEEHIVVPTSTTITISGSAIVDELRLYPKGAQMTTYTFDPLKGMTSQTDLNNQTTYYEYDALSRLKTIRNDDRDITKRFDYGYAPFDFKSSITRILDDYNRAYESRKTTRRSGHWEYLTSQGTLTDQSEFIKDGILHLPERFNSISPSNVDLSYSLNEPYCVTNGYSIETRVKLPQNSRNVPAYDVALWGSELFHYYVTINNTTFLAGYQNQNAWHYGVNLPVPATFDDWRVMKYKVTPSRIFIYFDGQLIQELPRDPTKPIAPFEKIYMGFKGHDASVDWVKVYNENDQIQYFEDFTNPSSLAKVNEAFLCPEANCQANFTSFFNSQLATSYSFSELESLYLQTTGQVLRVCF